MSEKDNTIESKEEGFHGAHEAAEKSFFNSIKKQLDFLGSSVLDAYKNTKNRILSLQYTETKQELRSLRSTIEKKSPSSIEKKSSVIETKKITPGSHHTPFPDVLAPGLGPIDKKGLQQRKKYAQSVVNMTKNAAKEQGFVGVLGGWATRFLHTIDI